MRIVREPGMTALGLKISPDRKIIRLNKQEMATIRRAINIREEVRDRLRDEMGWERFEDSDLYTLSVDEIVDEGDGQIVFEEVFPTW